jgi:hypothetical protein
MSTPLIKVLVPAAVAEPRGACWAAAVAVWIARVLFAPPMKVPA